LLIGFIAGCSNHSEGTYAAILFIEGKEYIGQITIQDEIGKVKIKVDEDTFPKQNFSSNSLKSRNINISCNREKNILFTKLSDEKYQIFSEKQLKTECTD
jgi:hypothetical protein